MKNYFFVVGHRKKSIKNTNFPKRTAGELIPGGSQPVKEHSVKLSRNGIIYATVEKTSKKAEKVRAIPAPCC